MVKGKFQAPRELRFGTGKGSAVTDLYYRNDIFHLRGMERITRHVEFYPDKRGIYQITSMDLVGSDLFLTDQYVAQRPVSTDLLVYPEEVPFPDLEQAFYAAMGSAVSTRPLIEDVFSFRGIRTYQPGDSIRSINWRATARVEEDLLVNIPEYVSQRPVAFFLNLTDNHVWKRTDQAEVAISAIAYLAHLFYDQGIRISLRCNAINQLTGGSAIIHGENMTCFDDFLRVLAGIDAEKVMPFDTIFKESTMVLEEDAFCCFFSLHPDPELLELLEKGLNMGLDPILVLPFKEDVGENFPGSLLNRCHFLKA